MDTSQQVRGTVTYFYMYSLTYVQLNTLDIIPIWYCLKTSTDMELLKRSTATKATNKKVYLKLDY